jgi:hypothetical protein
VVRNDHRRNLRCKGVDAIASFLVVHDDGVGPGGHLAIQGEEELLELRGDPLDAQMREAFTRGPILPVQERAVSLVVPVTIHGDPGEEMVQHEVVKDRHPRPHHRELVHELVERVVAKVVEHRVVVDRSAGEPVGGDEADAGRLLQGANEPWSWGHDVDGGHLCQQRQQFERVVGDPRRERRKGGDPGDAHDGV